MKKVIALALISIFAFAASALAGESPYRNAVAPGAASVTDGQPTHAVFVGVAADYDFYVKGSWVLFKGLLAGTIYPIEVSGVRDADDTDADAGDLLLLY